jgi:hypothetical protein
MYLFRHTLQSARREGLSVTLNFLKFEFFATFLTRCRTCISVSSTEKEANT